MTQQSSTNPLPRWRGFNLLEMFVADKSSGSRAFRENDFRWIADWGFDFIICVNDFVKRCFRDTADADYRASS